MNQHIYLLNKQEKNNINTNEIIFVYKKYSYMFKKNYQKKKIIFFIHLDFAVRVNITE